MIALASRWSNSTSYSLFPSCYTGCVTIQPMSIWGHGQLLAFSGIDGPTSYDNGLCLRTLGPGTSFAVMLPGELRLTIDTRPPIACDLAADHLDLVLVDDRRLRGAFIDHQRLLLEGPVNVEGADDRIHVRQEGKRTFIAVASAGFSKGWKDTDLDALIAARRWWADHHLARHGLTGCPAAVKAVRQLKGQIYAAEGIFRQRWSTPDRWPHRGCWLWDSAFHAIGARHLDAALARNCIDAVLDGQHVDGMIPIRSNPAGSASSAYTQPPTLVLAAWAISQVSPDPDWLRRILPRLVAYLDWDQRNRDGGNGLPVWAIEPNPNCRSGESGLDNASRFDAATRMEAVDFASFLTLEWELLARLSQLLGDAATGTTAMQHQQNLCALIRERLWDERSTCFRDWDLEQGAFCPVLAATGFLPLICGAASQQQADCLAAHLKDPDTFGTPLPLPSVARGDPSYEPDMWRGPVWVNLVHLVAAGFERYGLQDMADRLRSAMIAEIEARHAEHGTLFEYYDADGTLPPPQLRRKGRCAPEVSPFHQVFHDYGWTGTLYLDLLLAKQPLLPRLS